MAGDFISILPPELCWKIAGYLQIGDIFNLSLSNKHLNAKFQPYLYDEASFVLDFDESCEECELGSLEPRGLLATTDARLARIKRVRISGDSLHYYDELDDWERDITKDAVGEWIFAFALRLPKDRLQALWCSPPPSLNYLFHATSLHSRLTSLSLTLGYWEGKVEFKELKLPGLKKLRLHNLSTGIDFIVLEKLCAGTKALEELDIAISCLLKGETELCAYFTKAVALLKAHPLISLSLEGVDLELCPTGLYSKPKLETLRLRDCVGFTTFAVNSLPPNLKKLHLLVEGSDLDIMTEIVEKAVKSSRLNSLVVFVRNSTQGLQPDRQSPDGNKIPVFSEEVLQIISKKVTRLALMQSRTLPTGDVQYFGSHHKCFLQSGLPVFDELMITVDLELDNIEYVDDEASPFARIAFESGDNIKKFCRVTEKLWLVPSSEDTRDEIRRHYDCTKHEDFVSTINHTITNAHKSCAEPGVLKYLIIGEPDTWQLAFKVVWMKEAGRSGIRQTWVSKLVEINIIETREREGVRFDLYNATFLAGEERQCSLPWGF